MTSKEEKVEDKGEVVVVQDSHETMEREKKYVSRDMNWTMAAVGTTIALIALLTDFSEGESLNKQTRENKWAASAMSIALSLSWIALICTKGIRSRFVGSIYEGIMVFIVCCFSAAVMPKFMNPKSDIAVVDQIGGISNANLYFFTWFSFIAAFIILFLYVKEKVGKEILFTNTALFGCLCITSCVVAVSAGRVFRYLQCDAQSELDSLEKLCRRTAFAASLGTLSGIFISVWLLITLVCQSCILYFFEFIVSVIALVVWSCGVAYITFGGVNAPSTQVGNLYFFTWGSFALAVSTFIICLRDTRSPTGQKLIPIMLFGSSAAAAVAEEVAVSAKLAEPVEAVAVEVEKPQETDGAFEACDKLDSDHRSNYVVAESVTAVCEEEEQEDDEEEEDDIKVDKLIKKDIEHGADDDAVVPSDKKNFTVVSKAVGSFNEDVAKITEQISA